MSCNNVISANRDPPPPYRSPPPPAQALRKSPSRTRVSKPSHMSPVNLPEENQDPRSPEAVSYNSQYRELVSLVNYQREKLSSQQVDLIKVSFSFFYVRIFLNHSIKILSSENKKRFVYPLHCFQVSSVMLSPYM